MKTVLCVVVVLAGLVRLNSPSHAVVITDSDILLFGILLAPSLCMMTWTGKKD